MRETGAGDDYVLRVVSRTVTTATTPWRVLEEPPPPATAYPVTEPEEGT